MLANAGITDIDEVDTLTPEQYEYIINNVTVNANNNLQQIQIGLNAAYLYDGVTQTVPLLGDTQDLSTDSFLYDINSAMRR